MAGGDDAAARHVCAIVSDHQEAPPVRRALSRGGSRVTASENDCVSESEMLHDPMAPAGATPTTDPLERRFSDFATLGEALDYAATGRRGMNFHDARGTRYALEGMSPNHLVRYGWSRRSLQPGQVITLTYYPLRDGRNGGFNVTVTLPDGTSLNQFGERGTQTR